MAKHILAGLSSDDTQKKLGEAYTQYQESARL